MHQKNNQSAKKSHDIDHNQPTQNLSKATSSGNDNGERDVAPHKLLSYIDLLKTRAFVARESLIETMIVPLKKDVPAFDGLHTLFMMMWIIYVISHPVIRYVTHGEWFDLTLWNFMKQDILYVIGVWPILSLWSFTAFLLQKSVIAGLPNKIAYLIQFFTEIAIFAFCSYVIYIHDWPYSHGVFLGFQASIHFMKVHSYNSTNMIFREDYLESKKIDKIPKTPYPTNVNLKDFSYYMLVPTFVYWYEFPRTERIRWNVVLTKTIYTAFGLTTIYLLLNNNVYPVILMGKNITCLEAMFFLMVPLMLITHVVFYTTFDCIPNVYAELYKFADRDFYGEWWNCVNYEHFFRTWNKLVHEFCFRHLYQETMHRFKWSKKLAFFGTMVFSGLLHQTLASMVLKRIMFWYVVAIVIQWPGSALLDFLTKNYPYKAKNFAFWGVHICGCTWVFAYIFEEQFA